MSEVKPEEPWMDAARSALYYYESYREARTLLQQADYLVRLNNAMQDLVTWLPDYDERTGWFREDEEQ